MSPRREAKSLLSFSLKSVELFVAQTIRKVAPEIVRYHNECAKRDLEQRLASQGLRQERECDMNEDHEEGNKKDETVKGGEDENTIDNMLNNEENYDDSNEAYASDVNYRKQLTMDYVERLREHIFSHIPYSLIEDVKNKILKAIHKTAGIRRAVWKATSTITEGWKENDGIFSQEMMTIIDFIELIIVDHVKKLDLTDLVKMMRSRLFDLLSKFRGLNVLKLGAGSGGVSLVYHTKFLEGTSRMRQLVHFSLTYDCTDEIVRQLQRNCRRTLRILDVEYSNRVTDESVKYILKFEKLVQLHIFHTGLTTFGKAEIVAKSKNLHVLVRGDFLCDVLDYLDAEERLPQDLMLREFWSSEEYFFHDTGQMKLVQRACPRIYKMMFQFNKENVEDLMILEPFKCLTELHLWGGEFYVDRLNDLLYKIGPRLQVLYLIHVDQIDVAALVCISETCETIKTLGLYNCIFGEIFGILPVLTTHHENQIHNDPTSPPLKVLPFLDLERLAIVSECSTKYLTILIGAAINVRFLNTGSSASINDSCLEKIRSTNQLWKLEELKISKSRDLTIKSLYSLLDHCPKLTSIKGIEYWESVSKQELAAFRHYIQYQNYDLDTDESVPDSEETREKLFDNAAMAEHSRLLSMAF